jgi:hypothetical protein
VSNVKKQLLDEIKKKAERKEKLSEEIAKRNKNVEEFILKLLDELDTASSNIITSDIIVLYIDSVEQRIKILDSGAKIDVTWNQDASRIDGILVKWSEEYQKANNCEAQLYVDVASALFS